MHAATDRHEFAPNETSGTLRALSFALLAHALLVAALTWGVSWRSKDINVSAEAELWSAIPQQAAPKLVEPPPAPPPPTPTPVAPEPPKAAPKVPDADIALERQKKKLEQEKLEQERLEREKKLALEKRREQDKLEQEKKQKEKLALEKVQREKELKEKQALEKKREQEKLEQAKKAAEEKRQKEIEAKQQEKRRKENIARMAGLAGATGGAQASGSALQSSGPSAGYAGRIRARIKPNIVFTDEIADNPTAEVEVRTSPDGTIISRKLLKSSGSKNWDDAVLKAIDKTEVLPRDVDGRVPPALVISFRPRD